MSVREMLTIGRILFPDSRLDAVAPHSMKAAWLVVVAGEFSDGGSREGNLTLTIVWLTSRQRCLVHIDPEREKKVWVLLWDLTLAQNRLPGQFLWLTYLRGTSVSINNRKELTRRHSAEPGLRWTREVQLKRNYFIQPSERTGISSLDLGRCLVFSSPYGHEEDRSSWQVAVSRLSPAALNGFSPVDSVLSSSRKAWETADAFLLSGPVSVPFSWLIKALSRGEKNDGLSAQDV